MREKSAVEVELKIVLPGPEAESAIVERIRERGYRIRVLKPVKHIDTYLDTFDWLLLKKNLALRYRLADGKALYTVKEMGKTEEGIAKRMETEVSLDRPVDIPTEISVKQIRTIIDDIIYPRKLLEHIQIRTDRRRYRLVTPEGAKIELAFDTSISSLRGLHQQKGVKKLHELEAELLEGPEPSLGALSALLFDSFHYPLSEVSKFEVAIERFHIAIPSKKPPEQYRVRPDDRLDFAVRKILTAQMARLREHLPGLLKDIDTEFVHQARVSTRRMRSALKLFHDAIPPATEAFLEKELMWIGALLGNLRDLDVFLLNLARHRKELGRIPGKKKKDFADLISKRRQTPHADLLLALESPRYKNLERRLDNFLRGPLPPHPRAPLAVKPVRAVAPAIISGKFDAVILQGSRVLANPRMKQFHRLRIQMKRLRYACEFFAPAFDGALDPFIERTVEIQDCLGEMQDTVFTREFIKELFDEWKNTLVPPELVFLLGEIYRMQVEIAGDRQRKFGKIWERFASGETTGQLKEILSRLPPHPESSAGTAPAETGVPCGETVS